MLLNVKKIYLVLFINKYSTISPFWPVSVLVEFEDVEEDLAG